MNEVRGFKFVKILVLVLKKIEYEDKTKSDTFYLHSKVETVLEKSHIDDVFKLIYAIVISNLQKL